MADFFDRLDGSRVNRAGYERVLEATWTPQQNVRVTSTDLPDTWANALHRLGRDLHVRQYNGSIERIEWIADYDPDIGAVLLLSDVTVLGRGPDGWGMDGPTSRVDDPAESILACIADLVQDQVARARVAWPWGETGGFMSPQLLGNTAVWSDKGHHIAIGTL
ncbi:hypothetical protein [Williamsia sp.]|uniref:hypothetical protein n=1 Tax=Williamsia sp. TaxID=1872085 RepID=UPI002F944E40